MNQNLRILIIFLAWQCIITVSMELKINYVVIHLMETGKGRITIY